MAKHHLKRPLTLAMEKATVAALTCCFGEPMRGLPGEPETIREGCTPYEWEFAYGETGKVSLSYYPDSYPDTDPIYGPGGRSPWLACRWRDPATRGEDGYTRPRHLIDWPSSSFTYPSGKANLHSFTVKTVDDWLALLACHLMLITKPGSPENEAAGSITWEPSKLTYAA